MNKNSKLKKKFKFLKDNHKIFSTLKKNYLITFKINDKKYVIFFKKPLPKNGNKGNEILAHPKIKIKKDMGSIWSFGFNPLTLCESV